MHTARRELVLRSINVGVLASLLSIGAVDRPTNLGIQVRAGLGCLVGASWDARGARATGGARGSPAATRSHAQPHAATCSHGSITLRPSCCPQDYGGNIKTLALCPSTPNCIATSEEANDPNHYVPAWCVVGRAVHIAWQARQRSKQGAARHRR